MIKDEIILKYEKQIEVNKSLIQALEEIKPVINANNNKLIGKRIERALNEAIVSEKITISISKDTNTEIYQISLVYRSLFFKDLCEKKPFTVPTNSTSIFLSGEMKKSKKLISDIVIELINKEINILNTSIEKLIHGINNYDNMMAEFLNIKSLIEKFNAEYDESFRMDSNCFIEKIRRTKN